MQKDILVAVALVLCTGQAMAIYKCITPEGRITFQDAGCAGNGSASIIKQSASGPPLQENKNSWGGRSRSAVADAEAKIEIRTAINERRPAMGMTLGELEQALGLPQRVNTGTYQSGSSEQRVYDLHNPTWYVYTKGGTVTAFQSNTSLKKPVQCPSSLEIRNVETSASSVTLTEAQRYNYTKQLEAMRSCGK